MDALRETGGVWFGWNGEIVGTPDAAPAIRRDGNVTYATVGLTRRDYDQYYRGFSNATLWPVFHYRGDLARFDRQEYAGYLRVNAMLAKQLAALLRPDDLIWVHDYHLLPFAHALRELGVKNPIGFFLHIPFPSPDVLRLVPPHDELVKFMCAYDVTGFQTDADKQAFTDYIERRGIGTASEDGMLHAHGRVVKVAAYPIGVYPDAIAQAAVQYGARKPVKMLRDALGGRKLVMSVDRLDYSKGLVERFQAFERMLANAPGWQGRVSLVQIAPPTRSDVQTYQRIRETLEGEAGRINGRFSQLDWTPIQYLNRKYERNLLMAFFRMSQVGYVTPLRRRDEPRCEGIRRVAGSGRSGRARTVRVRGRRGGADGRAARQSVRPVADGRRARARAVDAARGTAGASRGEPRAAARERSVGVARYLRRRSAQRRGGGLGHAACGPAHRACVSARARPAPPGARRTTMRSIVFSSSRAGPVRARARCSTHSNGRASRVPPKPGAA